MTDEPVYDRVNEEIFTDTTEACALVWWLTNQLGGKVGIPTDEKFWKDNYPEDTQLVLRKEEGQLVLVAERVEQTAAAG
jgi:hypothetical protein